MTKLLVKAFDEAAKLSDQEQDILATIILEELNSDQRWDELFAKSRGALEKLANEALEEYHGGKTFPLDPEKL